MKKANIFKKLHIMWVIFYTTFWLSILVLYRDTFRGGYTRDYGNKWLKWWSGKIVDAAKIELDVKDIDKVQIESGKRYIIMSNHLSHYDIPVIMFTMPWTVRMVAKSELFKVPIWGRGLRHGEFISIDRTHIKQAKKDLAAAREKMESGVMIWISPEGGRSRTGKLRPFKKGGIIMAIESGATIIPVGIQGTEKVLKPDTLDFYPNQEVSVAFGTPIEASRFNLRQKDDLLEEVRSSITKLAGEEGFKEDAAEPQPSSPVGETPSPLGGEDGKKSHKLINRVSPYAIVISASLWIWGLYEVVQASVRSSALFGNIILCIASFTVMTPFVILEIKSRRKKS